MSSSSDAVVGSSRDLVPLATPELRTGVWTRFGAASVLGDAVTEQILSALAESTRAAARSQGYAVGWAEGQRAARDAARADAETTDSARVAVEAERLVEHGAAVAALQLAAAQLHDAVAGLSAAVEERATGLAWELTRELVGHELRSATGQDVVRRALELTPTEPVARLHLHPDQAAELREADLAELLARGVNVIPDPSLAWGDALVDCDEHVVDVRVSTAMERVREVLA
jgi:flagellar assembly protein FliH